MADLGEHRRGNDEALAANTQARSIRSHLARQSVQDQPTPGPLHSERGERAARRISIAARTDQLSCRSILKSDEEEIRKGGPTEKFFLCVRSLFAFVAIHSYFHLFYDPLHQGPLFLRMPSRHDTERRSESKGGNHGRL